MHDDCIDCALYGVVLVVFCRTTRRFLFLRELTDKPSVFKKKGMIAFPSETKEEFDSSVRATVVRLISEEVGVIVSEGVVLSIKPLTEFAHGIPIYVAWVVVEEEFDAFPTDTDVEHACWMTEQEIRLVDSLEDFFRIETITVLDTVTRLSKSALI